jgi:regulator of protease activity HflC (stomatin/prohibitin superfamily)
MKLGLQVATVAGLLFVGMLVFNQGLRLMNQPSNAAVLGGVAVMLAFLAVAVAVGRFCFRLIEAKVKRWTGEAVRHLQLLAGVCLVAGSMVSTTGCNKVIEPGHVGILVNQSGSDRGVQDFPIKTGRVFYNPLTETVYEYPTFVQTAKWTKDVHEGNPINEEITFTNKDQMLISADISLSYSLKPEKIPAFYVKFRSDRIENFTHGFLRNTARDMFNETAGKYTIEQVMGDNGPFLAEVRERLQKAVEPVGVQLEQFGLIGAPRPPQQVIDSINMKAQAIQNALRVENEIRQSEAEAKKRIAQAEGEARANQILASSITQNLVTWRQLDLQAQAVSKWNGTLPTYTGGNGPLPFLSVQK